MFCQKCGSGLQADAFFCGKCGSPVPNQSRGSAANSNESGADNPISKASAPQTEIYVSGNPEDFYKAMVGPKNQSYYLHQFSRFDGNGKVGASWHWPAFFFTGIWAAHRKMYGWFFAFWGIATLSTMFEKAGAPLLSAIIVFVPCIAFTIYANSLYYKNVKKKIAVARLTIKDDPQLLEYLRNKGGVLIIRPWAIWVFGGLLVIGILAAIALPAYQDYTKRAQLAEAGRFTPFNGKLDSNPFDKFGGVLVDDGETAKAPSLLEAEKFAQSKIDMNTLVPYPSVSITLHDGSKYVGQYMDGKYNGLGTYTWPDGGNYVGAFRDGQFAGQGTYTWSNGQKYFGEYKDGKQHGQGIEYRADGTILQSGIWENGVFIRGR